MELEVLRDEDGVARALRDRGAEVRVRGHRLEVTTVESDPYAMITRVLAERGVGLRLLRPGVKTLEDAYLHNEAAR